MLRPISGIVRFEEAEPIIGGVITNVYVDHNVCEGGFTIEYIKNKQKFKLVLGYTELGEWVETLEEIND